MNHRNIEDFQRALINLKGFNHNRDLTVSGELDEATNKSITEVISHMKRHLIDSIKDDPYNIVIISEWLIQFGYGSLIKDLLDEIFEKGLREIDFKFSNFVNDIGLLAQKDKVIIPYKITVDFDYEVDVSKL